MAIGLPVKALQYDPVIVEARLGKQYDGAEEKAYHKKLK
jgi:hypothetical protein